MASASILTNESEFDRQIATHWLTMRRSSNELLLTEPHPRQHPHRSAHCIEPSSHPGGPFHFHSANSLHSQFQTRNRSPNSFPESNSPADQRVRPINQLMMIKCWISSVCVCVCVWVRLKLRWFAAGGSAWTTEHLSVSAGSSHVAVPLGAHVSLHATPQNKTCHLLLLLLLLPHPIASPTRHKLRNKTTKTENVTV